MSELVVAPVTVSDVLTISDVIVKSGLFPAFKTRESAATLMLLCRAKGLDPMTAVERYHIVQGRPVMRADAMLGEFVRMGGRVEWHRRDDVEASATFSHPAGGSVTVSWTIDMARKAKLTGKDIWSQYPRQMLHARCVSEGVRSVLPGATNGLYTPEEAMQMEPAGDSPAVRVIEPVRATSSDPEPVASLPAPEPAPKPANHLQVVMQDFADAAIERGYDVVAANGKPSRTKLTNLAYQLCGDAFDPKCADDWGRAQDHLVETGDGDDDLVMEAEVVAKDASTPTDAFAIVDPFDED